ncbi:ribonuclease YeeF family protein [Metabacillus schmidteae]|uniref:ribonuclease YeeF family protein n=1 Tax=Metabacillus schmidteae TaxID=2730405 RepID=UPI00158E2864|nr:LXG domain-containing protein [Metabacillus schmidteae]
MKTLDVKSLLSGIDGTIQTINDHQDQINQLATDLKSFLSIGDAFSGKGADAIRAFYEECHVPFLLFYDQLLVKYRRALNGMKDAYPVVEPEENGFVSQDFLEVDLTTGLNTFKNDTVSMTDNVNEIVNKVSDIVSLPKLNDDDVIKGIDYVHKKITNTIEDLEDFDVNQTKELKEIEEDMTTLINYINEIASMFKGGKISVNTSDLNRFRETESFIKLQEEVNKKDWSNYSISSTPSILVDGYTAFSSIGNSFGTLSEGAALTETAYVVKRHGVRIDVTDQDVRVKNGKYIGIKGKVYHNNYIDSQAKLGNSLEIANRVRPSAAVTSAFKSKLGIAGIAVTAGENVYKNIESNASTSKVVGDAIVDVGLGAVSLAGGAAVVAAVAAGGAIPLLGVAAIGFFASTATAYILEGVKFGKGEKTVSDTIKDGVQSGIKTVAGWFD